MLSLPGRFLSIVKCFSIATGEYFKDAIEAIVDRTLMLKTGARGLHTELERVLMCHMYNIHNYVQAGIKDVNIDKHQVNKPSILI